MLCLLQYFAFAALVACEQMIGRNDNDHDQHVVKYSKRQTCKSARAFFMEAVPLKATTTVSLPQPTKQRVSCLVSQKL